MKKKTKSVSIENCALGIDFLGIRLACRPPPSPYIYIYTYREIEREREREQMPTQGNFK
jgi:hypothetical protein